VRTNSGLNKFPKSWEGPLIYEIDTRTTGNQGAASLVSRNTMVHDGRRIGTLRVGQSVKAGNVEIRYTERRGSNFSFQISKVG